MWLAVDNCIISLLFSSLLCCWVPWPCHLGTRPNRPSFARRERCAY